jgi:hypothetical protein
VSGLLLLTALVGATLIVVRGTICQPIRRIWPALLACAQCAGVWVGAAAGASGLVSVGRGRVLDAIVVGSATSLLAMAADAVLLKLLGEPSEGDRARADGVAGQSGTDVGSKIS